MAQRGGAGGLGAVGMAAGWACKGVGFEVVEGPEGGGVEGGGNGGIGGGVWVSLSWRARRVRGRWSGRDAWYVLVGRRR